MSNAQQVKAQRILKGLLQEPANKTCFTCTQKGPTYVLCPFSVYVCTACSGICRRFNWRVKGVSMSNFSDEEIKQLQAGGNGNGKNLWLARWTPETWAIPNPGEEQRIIRFMKYCFEKQAWKKDELPEVVPLEEFLGKSNLPPLQITFADGRPAGDQRQKSAQPQQQQQQQQQVAPRKEPTRTAAPVDDWGEDPWETTPKTTPNRLPQYHAQPQQQQPPPQQQQPVQQKPPQPLGTLNLLGDPIPAPSIIPTEPIPQPQQPAPAPAPPATEQKALWELFGAGAPAQPQQHQPQAPQQSQNPNFPAQSALEQQRLQLQRQQEEFAKQQQLFQLQQQQLQQQQQQLQQQMRNFQPFGQPIVAGAPAVPQAYVQPMFVGQPVFVQQPVYGQQFSPPVAQAPVSGVPAKDPFANLNWG